MQPTPPARLVTLGDLTLDIAVRARGPLVRGTDTPAVISFHAGGSAANVARAYAELGAPAAFIGCVGDDQLGRRLTGALRASGVQAHVVRATKPTARIIVQLEPDGQRSFATFRGAADLLRPADVRPAWLRHGALHLPLYSLLVEPLRSAALHAVQLVRAHSGAVSVDLASVEPLADLGPNALVRLLRQIRPELLFANSDEAAVVSGDHAALLELAPLVVIKQGRSGALILSFDNGRVIQVDVPTRPIETADTTGAGDAFDAGFLAAWLSGATLRAAAASGHDAARQRLRRPRPELVL